MSQTSGRRREGAGPSERERPYLSHLTQHEISLIDRIGRDAMQTGAGDDVPRPDGCSSPIQASSATAPAASNREGADTFAFPRASLQRPVQCGSGLPERYSRRDHGSDDRAGHGQEMRPRHGYGVSEVRLSRRTARHGRRRHGGDDRREARPSRSRTAARATPAHQLSPKNGRDGTQAAATATVEVLGQSRRRSAPRRRRIASRDLSGRCRRR